MMLISSLAARSSVRFSRWTAASAVASSSVLSSSSSSSSTTTTTVRNLNSFFPGVFSDQNSSTVAKTNTTSSTTTATTNNARTPPPPPTHNNHTSSQGGHHQVMKEMFSTKSSSGKSTATTTVSRSQIAAEVAEAHELSVAKAERIVTMVFDAITEAVSDSKSVQISKFGTFEKYTSQARTGRNPNTGEAIDIPSKERIRFRPAKHFKDAVQ